MSKQESMNRNDLEKISTLCYDLVSLRTGKILHLASTASLSPDLESRLTPEEKKLFNLVHKLSEEWKRAILRED
jgi:DNA replication initiation complex subunit (GINS family)